MVKMIKKLLRNVNGRLKLCKWRAYKNISPLMLFISCSFEKKV